TENDLRGVGKRVAAAEPVKVGRMEMWNRVRLRAEIVDQFQPGNTAGRTQLFSREAPGQVGHPDRLVRQRRRDGEACEAGAQPDSVEIGPRRILQGRKVTGGQGMNVIKTQ